MSRWAEKPVVPNSESTAPDSRATPPIPRRDLITWFVFGVWWVQSALLFAFVFYCGANLPFQDDYAAIDVINHGDALSLSTYWAPHNEYRLPIVRLLLLAMARAAPGDFRWMYFSNALILVAASLFLLLAFRRARGRTTVFDLIIPLSVLSPSHAISLIMILGMIFAQYLFLCALLLSAISLRFWKGGKAFWLWVVGLIPLPITGAVGLGISAPVVLYSGVLALSLVFSASPRDRRRGWALGAASVFTALLAMAYVLSGRSLVAEAHPDPEWGLNAFRATMRVLSMAAGGQVMSQWLEHPRVLELLVVGFPLLFFGGAVLALKRSSHARREVLGYGAFMAALLVLAFVIGSARAGFGPMGGLGPQYSLVFVPFLISTYRMVETGGGAWTRWVVGGGALLIALTLAVPSGLWGLDWGLDRRERAVALYKDLHEGTPLDRVAVEYYPHFLAISPEPFQRLLTEFRTHGEGPFRPGGLFWFFASPRPEFRPIDLGKSKKSKRKSSPGWEGQDGMEVRALRSSLVLESKGEASALEIPSIQVGGRGDVKIRVEILSPAAGTARLAAYPPAHPPAHPPGSPPGSPNEDPVIRDLPLGPGPNTLDFQLPSSVISGAKLRLVLSRTAGRYRLTGISVKEEFVESPGPILPR